MTSGGVKSWTQRGVGRTLRLRHGTTRRAVHHGGEQEGAAEGGKGRRMRQYLRKRILTADLKGSKIFDWSLLFSDPIKHCGKCGRM